MKLGYLSIPADCNQARILGGFASPAGRAYLAQSLGFTEFYMAEPFLKPGCLTQDETGPESEKLLRVLPELPQRPAPKLITADGEICKIEKPTPYRSTAPAQTIEDVQSLAAQGQSLLSVSWLDTDALAQQWSAYVTGCTHSSRIARSDDWRVARSVFVCPDAGLAEAEVKDLHSPCRAYYRSQLPAGADDSEVDALIDACVLHGTPATVLARLQEITDASVNFKTLTMVDHNWSDLFLARQSMALFAGAVLPTYQAQPRLNTRKLEHA